MTSPLYLLLVVRLLLVRPYVHHVRSSGQDEVSLLLFAARRLRRQKRNDGHFHDQDKSLRADSIVIIGDISDECCDGCGGYGSGGSSRGLNAQQRCLGGDGAIGGLYLHQYVKAHRECGPPLELFRGSSRNAGSTPLQRRHQPEQNQIGTIDSTSDAQAIDQHRINFDVTIIIAVATERNGPSSTPKGKEA
jgi:hypothetical protein